MDNGSLPDILLRPGQRDIHERLKRYRGKKSDEPNFLAKKRLSANSNNHYQEVLDEALNTLDSYIDEENARMRKRAHILLNDTSVRQIT